MVIGQSIAQGEIFKTYLPIANEGVVETKAVVDDTYRLYGYRALSSYPLVVQAGLSRKSFVGPWKQDLLKTGWVLLALIGGLAGFGFVVMYQLRQRMAMEKEIRRAHQALKDMALTDSLTGLGNRRKLDRVLTEEIGQAKRQGSILALIMVDVDYFKRFNDRYGHATGDACLRDIGNAIQNVLKRPVDLAVRYGGEEFAVLLPETDSNTANSVAEELLACIRSLNIEHDDSPQGFVTASAGVCIGIPWSEDVTAAGMIKEADAFLYRAKQKGRDRWQAANGDSDLERLLVARRSD